MKIAIIGGRDFSDYDLLKNTLNEFINNKSFLSAIISGGAKGADLLAEKYANELGTEIVTYLPDYKRYGRAATLVRNTQIIEHSAIRKATKFSLCTF